MDARDATTMLLAEEIDCFVPGELGNMAQGKAAMIANNNIMALCVFDCQSVQKYFLPNYSEVNYHPLQVFTHSLAHIANGC